MQQQMSDYMLTTICYFGVIILALYTRIPTTILEYVIGYPQNRIFTKLSNLSYITDSDHIVDVIYIHQEKTRKFTA